MVYFLNDQEADGDQLGGPGYVIEMDERSFKKKSKYGRGKVHKDRWVFGITERDPSKKGRHRQRFFAVPNRSRQVLLSLILKHVKPGTTLMTDAWGAYKCLGNYGFKHQVINHSAGFVDKDCPEVCSCFKTSFQVLKHVHLRRFIHKELKEDGNTLKHILILQVELEIT